MLLTLIFLLFTDLALPIWQSYSKPERVKGSHIFLFQFSRKGEKLQIELSDMSIAVLSEQLWCNILQGYRGTALKTLCAPLVDSSSSLFRQLHAPSPGWVSLVRNTKTLAA